MSSISSLLTSSLDTSCFPIPQLLEDWAAYSSESHILQPAGSLSCSPIQSWLPCVFLPETIYFYLLLVAKGEIFTFLPMSFLLNSLIFKLMSQWVTVSHANPHVAGCPLCSDDAWDSTRFWLFLHRKGRDRIMANQGGSKYSPAAVSHICLERKNSWILRQHPPWDQGWEIGGEVDAPSFFVHRTWYIGLFTLKCLVGVQVSWSEWVGQAHCVVRMLSSVLGRAERAEVWGGERACGDNEGPLSSGFVAGRGSKLLFLELLFLSVYRLVLMIQLYEVCD